MTPRYTPGKNATAVFLALADLFVVHKIPATPIGVCGRHRCFPAMTLVGAKIARIVTAFTLCFRFPPGCLGSSPMLWLWYDEASWVTLVSINLLKLNWFLITELNPSSCIAKDSRILLLARHFLLILSFICFWPYTKSLSEGWKLLLKLLPCCWPKGGRA